jgi:hypothetical protein
MLRRDGETFFFGTAIGHSSNRKGSHLAKIASGGNCNEGKAVSQFEIG